MAAGGSETSAVYLSIRNSGPIDDTLLDVQTDVAVAAEIHRTTAQDGVMRMGPAGPLLVPAGGTLALEPGGLHIMLIGLHQDLRPGSQVRLTLRFERAGDVEVLVPIRAAAGMAGS